jgi:hypothetical protein
MIPQKRILVRKDEPNANAGSIILPLHLVEVYSGKVVESKIQDVPVGCRVTVREDTAVIELNGKQYFSAAACDLLLVTKT